MKRKNIIFGTLIILSGLFAIQSCQKADDTTYTPKAAFGQPVCSVTPSVRGDGTVLFTGTTVELSWASTNKDGDPVAWDVYFGNGKAPALFQAGVTTNKITVPVFDGLTYYWKVEIADSKEVLTTSKVNTFIAVNGTSAKMKLNLTATTDVKNVIGLDLEAGSVIDLILDIKCPLTPANDVSIDMGTSDEEFGDFHNMPDGDYEISIDWWSAKFFGAFNKPLSVSLTLDFYQLGFINEKLEYPGVIDNWSAAALVTYTPGTVTGYIPTKIAKFTKAGPRYTITREVTSDLDKLKGEWKGIDALAYPSHIVCKRSGPTMVLENIGTEWMVDWWEEEITASTPTKIYFDWKSKTILIPNQTYCTTRYMDSSVPPKYVYTNYNIQGSGTFNMTGLYPTATFTWYLYAGGSTTTKAHATAKTVTITLDPA